jgi:DNA invertase Pin-like site-specific DNA recombinase
MRAGSTRLFQEKVSGTRTKSYALDELLAAVRESDVVIVNRLARLGRNTGHTIPGLTHQKSGPPFPSIEGTFASNT